MQLRAIVVGAPGELCVVGRMARFGDVEKDFALALGVAVEKRLLGAAVLRRAAEDRMLAALIVADVVEVGRIGAAEPRRRLP